MAGLERLFSRGTRVPTQQRFRTLEFFAAFAERRRGVGVCPKFLFTRAPARAEPKRKGAPRSRQAPAPAVNERSEPSGRAEPRRKGKKKPREGQEGRRRKPFSPSKLKVRRLCLAEPPEVMVTNKRMEM